MSFDKSFYKQMSPQIKKEFRDYKARQETTEIKVKHCKHKDVKVTDGELRCKCGAAWRGARIIDLYNKFKGA